MSGKTVCLAVGHVVDGLGSQWRKRLPLPLPVSFPSVLQYFSLVCIQYSHCIVSIVYSVPMRTLTYFLAPLYFRIVLLIQQRKVAFFMRCAHCWLLRFCETAQLLEIIREANLDIEKLGSSDFIGSIYFADFISHKSIQGGCCLSCANISLYLHTRSDVPKASSI